MTRVPVLPSRAFLVALALASTIVALGGGALATWWTRADRAGGVPSPAGPSDYGRVPRFALIERSGRRVGLDDLRGRVWLASFIYTECRDTCPLESAQLSRLQGQFADAPDFRIASISIDPEHDTPAVLRQYARRFGAGDRWLFLTGSRHDTHCLATRGFHLPVADTTGAVPVECGGAALGLGPEPAWARDAPPRSLAHSPRVALVDREARIRSYRTPTDPEDLDRLRQEVRALLAAR